LSEDFVVYILDTMFPIGLSEKLPVSSSGFQRGVSQYGHVKEDCMDKEVALEVFWI
jgi:hypothetical protein